MWTKESIRKLLEANDLAVERAVLALYARQTAREQASDSTIVRNGIGFSASDAPYLSYVARWLQSGKHLSGRHVEKTRKMVMSYVGQLADIANGGRQTDDRRAA